jgi:serine/threonine protein kinase
MVCPRCGKNNDDREYRFCVYCGAALPNLQDGATLILPDQGADAPPDLKPEQAEDLVGQLIDGNYRLESVMGRGGVGMLYRATRLKFGDEVAVKIVRLEVGVDAALREQFQSAAQSTARLKHPGMVALYDFGITPEGLMFLVMELAEGHTVRDLIRAKSPLEPRVVAEITTQVCAVLDEAARFGVVHGEISPQSIVVRTTPAGILVKVLGFGLAPIRVLAADHQPGTVSPIGNPRYWSPEQCLEQEVDGRSDLYTLGLVIFEMLSGTVPYDSPSSIAAVAQKLTQPPPSLQSANPKLSAAVEAVVVTALARDRDERPQPASSFARQLHRAIYGSSGTAAATAAYLSESAPLSVATEVKPAAVPLVPAPMAAAAPVGFATTPTGAAPQTQQMAAAQSRSRLPFMIGGAVLVLAALVVGGIFLVPLIFSSSSNRNQAPNKNQANVKPETTPGPTPDASAETEYNELREKLLNTSPAQRAQVRQDLVSAEGRHPADYRFPYLRAKLLIDSGREHHEAFEALYDAGKKAIAGGKSDAMGADLERDSSTSFTRLTDHEEWRTLLTGLQNKDADSLKLGHTLH